MTSVVVAFLVTALVVAITLHWPNSRSLILKGGAVGAVIAHLILHQRQSLDTKPWLGLILGVALVVASTPAVVTVPAPNGSSDTLFAVCLVAAAAAYPLMFSSSLRLLHYRRNQIMPHVHAWFDGLGSVLGLTAILAAAPIPAVLALGFSGWQAWSLLGRPVLMLVLTAFALANCQLAGWGIDRRLTKLLMVFCLLLGSEVLDVSAALGTGAGTQMAAATGMRVGALVLLTAAASRRTPRPTAASAISWAALAGPVSVVILTLVAGVLRTSRSEPSALTFALTAMALTVVLLKFIILVRTLVDLLDSRRLSMMDDLTGLPNRRAFFQAAEQCAQQEHVAVLLLDLNGFKNINDTLGHGFGDTLLQDTARRLEEVVPEHATLARLGGDEFVILLSAVDEATAGHVAQNVYTALGPRTVDGHQLSVSSSIGVAHKTGLSRGHGRPQINIPHQNTRSGRRAARTLDGRRRAEELLHAADQAMYEAKQSGGGWRLAGTATR